MLFTTSQREKKYWKNIACECRHSKKAKTEGFGSTLPQYLSNPRTKFPLKFTFAWSISVLLPTGKKAKTISFKVFKITDLKNLQQETTKGTLRA